MRQCIHQFGWSNPKIALLKLEHVLLGIPQVSREIRVVSGVDYLTDAVECQFCEWKGEIGDMLVSEVLATGSSKYACPECRQLAAIHEGPLIDVDDVI
jgi:hypothetical protein